ncbi:hypothetical protein C8D77_12626 [Mesorhizobium loti]|jgi:hypothetical protein|uniref:Uncharacterized protein n=1 Tax=Rhizobium loti TaxID=381 RepID=A0A8E3B1M1_RHILI|nr:hypothetical protein C8D77_12626 [Mesorhizobium loti]
MKNYRVEEMDGASILSTCDAQGRTPFEAAEKARGHRVTLRGSCAKWIRVTDLVVMLPTQLRPRYFEFRLRDAATAG